MNSPAEINTTASVKDNYKLLEAQIKSLVEDEWNLMANLANITAALHQTFNFHWVGFYLVEDNQLVLGPFQGPVACTRIGFGKGVCGTAWRKAETIVVDDVHQFEGHIACSPKSKSEIVLPIKNKAGDVCAVLDIDSDQYATFNAEHQKGLMKLLPSIEKLFN
jgi:L-methionine (R)-S-oxide reductase